jgi:predicted pyridoxine 5'-phosphate oxidase superfamily flavin-nucleotide-binding protein
VRWAAFETAAPELAAQAREVLVRDRFVLLGTIRRDGAPRISPVEAHLAGGELMLVLIAASQKARDVARDPRVTLQSPVFDARDPGVEVKLRGRVVAVDAAQRAAAADVVERSSGWRPRESWSFLAVDADAMAVIVWEAGEMVLGRWDARGGVRPVERRRLDVDASAYVRAD